MANSIVDPQDPDYCETCGGECVAGCRPRRQEFRYYRVVQSDGKVIETHNTRTQADHAVEVLNTHEAQWAARVAAGDQLAARAASPGRPFTYHVRAEGRLT